MSTETKSYQKLAAENMTRVHKLARALQSGQRKSELRTVQEAIHMARGLSMQIESEGLKPDQDFAVHIAYMTPDLPCSSLGSLRGGRKRKCRRLFRGAEIVASRAAAPFRTFFRRETAVTDLEFQSCKRTIEFHAAQRHRKAGGRVSLGDLQQEGWASAIMSAERYEDVGASLATFADRGIAGAMKRFVQRERGSGSV